MLQRRKGGGLDCLELLALDNIAQCALAWLLRGGLGCHLHSVAHRKKIPFLSLPMFFFLGGGGMRKGDWPQKDRMKYEYWWSQNLPLM